MALVDIPDEIAEDISEWVSKYLTARELPGHFGFNQIKVEWLDSKGIVSQEHRNQRKLPVRKRA